jgi:hypothetical protein
MSQAFCRQAYDLITEVATCPAENLPPFNVRLGRQLGDAPMNPRPLRAHARPLTCMLQDDLFRSVVDEIQLQHDQLTTVFKCAPPAAVVFEL